MNPYDRCLNALQKRVDEYDRLWETHQKAGHPELAAFARVRASAWAAAWAVVQDLKHRGEDPRNREGGVAMGDTNISVQLSTNGVGEVTGINVLGSLFSTAQVGLFNDVPAITFVADDVGLVIADLEGAIAQLREIGAAKI